MYYPTPPQPPILLTLPYPPHYTPPNPTPTLLCPLPYPNVPLCSDHTMYVLPYPTPQNLPYPTLPTHPTPLTPFHRTLPALPYPSLPYSTLRRDEESKEKNSLTKTYTIKTKKLTNNTLQIPLKLNLNLNSLLVKRQIYNPSPGAVTGGRN